MSIITISLISQTNYLLPGAVGKKKKKERIKEGKSISLAV